MGVAVVRPALVGGHHAAVVGGRFGHGATVRAQGSGVTAGSGM